VELTSKNWTENLKTELWIMNRDGNGKRQLTHFNTPGHRDRIGNARCVVSDNTWSPDGKSVLFALAYFRNKQPKTKLMILKEKRTQ